MSIPIQNLYFLLCYAWDRLDEAGIVGVQPEHLSTVPDLLGYVLGNGVTHLLKRGLDRVYIQHDEEIRGVRGKLDVASTLKRGLIGQGRANCAFDELRFDAPHNQILKATLRTLSRVDGLDPALRRHLEALARRMTDVRNIRISRRVFRSVQIHRNNGFYDFLLHVSRLVYDSMSIETKAGHSKFRDFIQDRQKMPLLFQQFVRNFLRREQKAYKVEAKEIDWFGAETSAQDFRFLPKMRTDMVLTSPTRTIVIDTKFYRRALVEHHGNLKVRSEHLYQICTYVRNLAPQFPNGHPVDGMLLYPTVGESLDLRYRLEGRTVFVRTINLAQATEQLRSELLQIVGDTPRA